MSQDQPSDRSELSVRYLAKFEGNVRAYVASLLNGWGTVDDDVQFMRQEMEK